MSTVAKVAVLPSCDLCKMGGRFEEARYDARTRSGRWGNLCQAHFDSDGVGLGTGSGQYLVIEGEDPTPPRACEHDECHGPTGVFCIFKCSGCGNPTRTNTCWVNANRVPIFSPVQCDECSAQGFLL